MKAYPAVFNVAVDGISIEFPDLPGCLPCGSSLDEAERNAQEALSLHLHGMAQDGDPIPAPSDPAAIQTKGNQFVRMIAAK